MRGVSMTDDVMQDQQAALDDSAAGASEAGVSPEQDVSGNTDNAELEAKGAVTPEQQEENERKEAEKRAAREDRKQRSLDRRFAELTEARYQEKARADQLERQLQALRQQALVQQPSGEPVREQFENYEDFIAARAEYRAEQRSLRVIEEHTRNERLRQQLAEREFSAKREAQQFVDRAREFAKATPDFHEVMEDANVEVPDSVLAMIRRSPDGPALAYHLVKQPELAQQFYESSPEMHGFLLGQMAATLKATTARQVSNAPPARKVRINAGRFVKRTSD